MRLSYFLPVVLFVLVALIASACGDGGGEECFYATTCLKTDCKGAMTRSGCGVVCGAGEVDQRTCFATDASSDVSLVPVDGAADAKTDAADATANGSSDASPDAPSDAKSD